MPHLEPLCEPAPARGAPPALFFVTQKRRSTAALTVALTFALACGVPGPGAHAADRHPASASPIQDPFEPFNRVMFGVHQALDAAIFRPAAETYERLTPVFIRHVLHNAVINLGEPRTAVNDALQGRAARTLKSVVRFTLNTTLGLAGMFDVAAHGGLPAQPNDFGVTLAHMGVRAGPYLFIPLFGPTTVRDVVGNVADLALNPLTYARYTGDTEVGVASVVSEGLYQRAASDGSLKSLDASATDLYASFRSYYLQNREGTITGGRIDLKSLPDFGDETPAAEPPAIARSPTEASPSTSATPPAPSAPEGATTPAASPSPPW